jgi:hypothetical protein
VEKIEIEKPGSYDVFISYYSGSGKDFARYLKKYLTDFNLTSFLDEEDIPKSIEKATDEWRNFIDNSIRKSYNFTLLMTHGFNKRPEVIREIKEAIEAKKKMYFFKYESMSDSDLTIEIDSKTIDLSKYQYIPFNNEHDLLRKVVASLLGKIGQDKKSTFTNKAKELISAEGINLKNTDLPLLELVLGPMNEAEEWLLPTSENKFLISCFPYFHNTEVFVRRKFFENEPKNELFLKVSTSGFFHSITPFLQDGREKDLYYYDVIIYQISALLFHSIRIMKFHNIENEQSLLVIFRNLGGKKVAFEDSFWRIRSYSFTSSSPEVEFLFSFCPKDDWKEIVNVLINLYRELCTETGCIDISDSTIKSRLHQILRSMRELSTEYTWEGVRLPRVDFNDFGFTQ